MRRGTARGMVAVALVTLAAGCTGREAPTTVAARGGSVRGLDPVGRGEAGAASGYRATWAVIVGIDGYPSGDGGLAPLEFAANDARAVRDVLRDEYGFD